jgi:intracellular sulfur oxidation DsrE/DsrF family protein
MKKIVSSTAAFFLCSFALMAQKNYKVVFDLTSGDSLSQQTAVRWMNEVAKAEPTSQVEVVMFGKGTALAVKDKSAVADAVANLANNKNVSFKICAVAMQNQKIDQSQLLPGIQIVPDGIYEIISKQREGWGYIKVAH